MNPQIYYSPRTTSAQNRTANGQGTQRSDTRVPTGHPSASTQAQQSQTKRPRRRNQRSKADPDLIAKSWKLHDTQGLSSPVILKQDNTTSTSSYEHRDGTPPDHHTLPCTNNTMNKVPNIPATEVGESRSGIQETNPPILAQNTFAAPFDSPTSTYDGFANAEQHKRLPSSPPSRTANRPRDPLAPYPLHAVPSPATLASMEDRPQRTPPSYPYPLAIETATGVYLIPFTTDREEIAAFVEKAHFILTPEMDRMLAWELDGEPSRPEGHIDTQPIQASSKGKRALKRRRNETEEVGDESRGPKTKRVRSETLRGATAQGDVTATAEHQPEPQPLNNQPLERYSSSD